MTDRDSSRCPVRNSTDPDYGRLCRDDADRALIVYVPVHGPVPLVDVCAKHKHEIEADPSAWLLRCGLGPGPGYVVYRAS